MRGAIQDMFERAVPIVWPRVLGVSVLNGGSHNGAKGPWRLVKPAVTVARNIAQVHHCADALVPGHVAEIRDSSLFWRF